MLNGRLSLLEMYFLEVDPIHNTDILINEAFQALSKETPVHQFELSFERQSR